MATWQVFQRLMEIEARRQLRINYTILFVAGLVVGVIIGYGIR